MEQLQELLELQETDILILREEQALDRFPRERKALAAEEVSLDAGLEKEKGVVQGLEVRRKDHETSLQTEEAKVNRFLTQQLSVKKNEEYQALETEIATTRAKIATEEEAIIGLLDEIDGAKAHLSEQTAETVRKKGLLAERRVSIDRMEAAARQDVEEARALRLTQAQRIAPDLLAEYETVRTMVRRPPYVCRLEHQVCSGCHGKVTHAVAQDVRNGKRTHCNLCERLLYI